MNPKIVISNDFVHLPYEFANKKVGFSEVTKVDINEEEIIIHTIKESFSLYEKDFLSRKSFHKFGNLLSMAISK
ncbi:MAG: hypothetical protein HYV97_18740 [Bdellovibrio sp.]|nr:hypothetical protein [Bdellovibrio sp.]